MKNYLKTIKRFVLLTAFSGVVCSCIVDPPEKLVFLTYGNALSSPITIEAGDSLMNRHIISLSIPPGESRCVDIEGPGWEEIWHPYRDLYSIRVIFDDGKECVFTVNDNQSPHSLSNEDTYLKDITSPTIKWYYVVIDDKYYSKRQ